MTLRSVTQAVAAPAQFPYLNHRTADAVAAEQEHVFRATTLRDAAAPMLATHRPRAPEIIAAVAQHYDLLVDDILGDSRKTPEARWPRHIAMMLARALTTRSYPDIARHFRRDHSTVIHGVSRGQKHLQRDGVAEEVVAILRRLAAIVERRIEQRTTLLAGFAEVAPVGDATQ